jgi:DtxR family Mn-dependent transcriptional regulator
MTVTDLIDTTEMYLRTIFELEEEGIVPLRARIAERLGHSGPTVSQTVARMERDGLVAVSGDRHLELSDHGRLLATRVMRKHRLAERLLVDVIGLEWEKVHAEAARWEHAISADVEEKLVLLLGDPATCPHGNPIPGSHNVAPRLDSMPLADAQQGPIVVTRVSERLEMSDSALSLIATAHLLPGNDATVVARDADGVTVKTATGEFQVPARIADSLYVALR